MHYFVIVALAFILAGCGGSTGGDSTAAAKDAGARDAGTPRATPLTLTSVDSACSGQRAVAPDTAELTYAVAFSTVETNRYDSPDGVYDSYTANASGVSFYASFLPTLPGSPSSEDVRSSLQYANVGFSWQQPEGIGGSIELLSSSQLLSISDFQRFEVIDGTLYWRLVSSAGPNYTKTLSLYDSDPANDPPANATCLTGDIAGICSCSFTGPSLAIILEGSLPL